MIDLKLRVEIDKANAAFKEMQAKLSGSVTSQRVIEYEVVKILQATLARTKTATSATITTTAKKPWRTWDLGHGTRHYYLKNRYPDALWVEMTKRIADGFDRRLATVGLSRRAWWELGIRVQSGMTAPPEVRRAVSPRGHTGRENVAVARAGSPDKFTLAIENASPLIRWSNSSQAFYSAVRGRRRYFEQNLAHGVFNDMAQVAKKYPGMIVTVPPAAVV